MHGPLILAYHSVSEEIAEPALQVRPSTMARHLRWLCEADYQLVDVADLCRRAFAGEDARGLAALTFDDGYVDFRDAALPCLERFGTAPATLFVCPEHVGRDARWNFRARMLLPHLDLPALKALFARGVRIESHGWSHRNFCQMTPAELEEGLDRCAGWFDEHFGRPSRLLAYPYGDYDDAHLPVVEARAEFAFAVGEGRGFADRRAVSRRCVGEFTTKEKLLSPLSARGLQPANNVTRIS